MERPETFHPPLFPGTKEKDEILILPLNLKATHGKRLCDRHRCCCANEFEMEWLSENVTFLSFLHQVAKIVRKSQQEWNWKISNMKLAQVSTNLAPRLELLPIVKNLRVFLLEAFV